MRLLIFLAVWKRPEITEICFMGINRLRKAGKFPIEAFAVISENSMIPLCKKYDIKYCGYKNEPLGEKKNHGLTEAMKIKNWDYLIEIGSDDILKTEILDLYTDYFGLPLFGISSAYYINSIDGDCREYKTNTAFGMGRAISRKVLETHAEGVEVIANDGLVASGRSIAKDKKGFLPSIVAKDLERCGYVKITSEPSYKLWSDNINMGMDNNSTWFLMTQGIPHKRISTEKPLGIDIKGSDNIWPYNPELGAKADIQDVLTGLSGNERLAIISLIKRNRYTETGIIR